MRIIVTMRINVDLKDNAVRLSYKLINNLLYFDDSEIEIRLYVLIRILEYKVFRLAHDEMKYFDYTRTYKKLTRNIYILNIIIKLHKYLRYYSYCQLY